MVLLIPFQNLFCISWFWRSLLTKSGTGNGSKVTNADTNFKYTGDDTSTSNQIFSYTLAKQLADSLTGTNGM